MPLTSTCPRPCSGLVPLPANQPRGVRVAASFCRNRLDALRLMALLASHPGVQEQQLALLAPADAAAHRFALCRQRWDCLRPGHQAQGCQDTPVPMAMAGAMLGATAGLALATGLTTLGGVIALPALTALAGWLIAMLVQQRRHSGGKRHRFDQRLQRRLAQGWFAVVLVGVWDQPASVQAMQSMREGAVSWCAEVSPLRRG